MHYVYPTIFFVTLKTVLIIFICSVKQIIDIIEVKTRTKVSFNPQTRLELRRVQRHFTETMRGFIHDAEGAACSTRSADMLAEKNPCRDPLLTARKKMFDAKTRGRLSDQDESTAAPLCRHVCLFSGRPPSLLMFDTSGFDSVFIYDSIRVLFSIMEPSQSANGTLITNKSGSGDA